MDLILIRHPAVAAEGLCYGRSDMALAAPPQAECERLGTRLAALAERGGGRPPQLYSSPLSRCALVAQGLSERFGVPVAYDARLRELDFGAWEGQSWERIPRAEIDAWAADLEHARPHGGESAAQLALRSGAWLVELPHQDDGLVVSLTHGGVIRVLAACALQIPLARCLDWQLAPGAWCHLRRHAPQAAWSLVTWNA